MEDPFCAFQLAQMATTHRDRTEGGRPTSEGGRPTTPPGRPTSSKGSGGRPATLGGRPASSKRSGGQPAHLVVSQLNWSPRRKGGLPPLYHLPNKENKVHAKNEPRRMQSEGGHLGHSVPVERGNQVCAKNRSKQRKLSGPKPRRTADGSENRKLVSKREQWSMTTKRKAQKSPEVRMQGSQPRLHNLRTSTTCAITERSIDDV
ncbi:hypothetical protein CsSME_00051806 [Camellia sinensis var. sinensis]